MNEKVSGLNGLPRCPYKFAEDFVKLPAVEFLATISLFGRISFIVSYLVVVYRS